MTDLIENMAKASEDSIPVNDGDYIDSDCCAVENATHESRQSLFLQTVRH